LGGKTFLFAHQSQHQVLGAYVTVRQPLRLFSGISQNALGFVAQRQIDRSGNLFAKRGVALNLFPDGFDRCVRAQEAVGQSLVFA
jgi:hypothetical protein